MPAVFLVAAMLAVPSAAAAEGVVVQRPAVPASGQQSTLVTVPAFGRYAISAESPQGTAVQLVTRASGPGEVVGVAGERNGRLDTFLDRGEYKVAAWSDPAGTGQARISVRPFAELNVPAVSIRPLQPIVSTLADLQQRTWWIQGEGQLDIEAAGRSLADLRIWRDGSWLVDVAPDCVVETPSPGRDLRRCTISTAVEEGVYAVIAYGGASLPWASSAADQPLHLRVGMPVLAEAGRARYVASGMGVDRYLVPGATQRVSLALATPGDATVAVAPVAPDPFSSGTVGRIRKESMPPQVSVTATQAGFRVVSVRADAGTPYTLAWFPVPGPKVAVPSDGSWFLATLPDGAPGDSVDATAILDGRKPDEPPIATSTILAGPDLRWERRFNLLATTSVLVEVQAAGTYEVGLEGVAARFRFEPLARPPNYKEAALAGPGRVELNPGFYRLTLEPTSAGIVTASLRPGGWADRVRGALGANPLRPLGLRASAQFTSLSLTKGTYALRQGNQPGVSTGIVLRKLPLALDQALPLWLGADAVSLSMEAPGPRVLRVVAEDGRPCELSVDGGPWAVGGQAIMGGLHAVAVRHSGTEPVFVSVSTTPPELLVGAPLDPGPTLALPDFPVVSVDQPRSGELGGEAVTTYGLRVDQAALVRLETTGLLATSGVVRTRTETALHTASANGVGRNFLVQTWLGEGDYQVSVTAVSPSAGHYGVRLTPVAIRDGGLLGDGLPARAELAADEGIGYRVKITTEGDYDLRSYGPGRDFRVRFEDGAGFPLAEPEVAERRTWHLVPGDYRVVLLPERVPSRRITELARVAAAVVRNGHGPHPLPIAEAVDHTWWETDPRLPDVWQVDVPAPMHATLEIDAEMIATLYRQDAVVGRSVPGVTWSGTLDPGAYRVEAVNARQNSGVDYRLQLQADELVAGSGRMVSAPVEVPVSVGTAGTYAFRSVGDRDVRATLLRDGVVVASNDDRPADWNFALREQLVPGRYVLKVDPVGGASASVQIEMRAHPEVDGVPLSLGVPVVLTPGVGASGHLVETPPGGLLVVNGTSDENLGIAVDHRLGSAWEEVGAASGRAAQVLVRLGGARGSWRVRVWSMDGRAVPATVRADVVAPLRTTEAAFRSGFGVGAVKASAPKVGVAVVKADRAGLFAVETSSGASWCPYADRACAPLPSTQVPAHLGELWLVRDAEAGLSFRGRRVVVGEAWTPVAAGAAEGVLDLARSPGVSLVFAADGLLVDAGGGGPGRWDRGAGLSQDRSVALSLRPDLASVRVRARAPELRPVAEGRVRLVRVVLPEPEPMRDARADGALSPGAARRLSLPAGTDAVRVVVGPDTVVARLDAGVVGALVVGPADALLPGPGAEVLLVNGGTDTAGFLVDSLASRG